MGYNRTWPIVLRYDTHQYGTLQIKSLEVDDRSYDELLLSAKLNVQADTIATHHSRKLINTHLVTSPFVIYVDNKYISRNIDRKIRDSSHSSIAKDFLARKYNWTMQLMEQNN